MQKMITTCGVPTLHKGISPLIPCYLKPMIIGLGTDLVEVNRIKALMERMGMERLDRVFSQEEITYCQAKGTNSPIHLAARFAAKEALAKALGTGFAVGVRWKDVCVSHDETGRPRLQLEGYARELADGMGVREIHVSMTHTAKHAMATVILEGD